MIIGRRPEAVEGWSPTARRRAAARPQPYRFSRPTDVGVGPAGQHLRLRRLHQLARREVRQERPVHQVGRHARHRAEPVQHAALASRSTRKGNVYVGRSRQRRIQVFDNDLTCGRSTTTSAARGRSASRPGPHQYLFSLELESRQRQLAAVAGHHRRDLQDGARRHDHRQVRQGRASSSGSSAPSTRWTAANPNEIFVAEITTGACRRSSCCKPAGPPTRAAQVGGRHETLLATLLPRRASLLSAGSSAVRAARRSGDPLRLDADLLKLPADIYLGEAAAWPPIRRATSSSTRAPGNPIADARRRPRRSRARRLAPVRVRPNRQVRPRDRPGRLRLHLRARTCASIRRTTSGSSTRRRTRS